MKKIKVKFKMFGLCAYNLSSMQKGIQFLHATTRYGIRYGGPGSEYDQWGFEDESVVLLCGGTTNKHPDRLGTLNKYMNQLGLMNVLVTPFQEEDLGDQLSAFAFLVDERACDRTKYPDFQFAFKQGDKTNPVFQDGLEKTAWEEWVDSIGGIQNNLLREFLRPLKLAV